MNTIHLLSHASASPQAPAPQAADDPHSGASFSSTLQTAHAGSDGTPKAVAPHARAPRRHADSDPATPAKGASASQDKPTQNDAAQGSSAQLLARLKAAEPGIVALRKLSTPASDPSATADASALLALVTPPPDAMTPAPAGSNATANLVTNPAMTVDQASLDPLHGAKCTASAPVVAFPGQPGHAGSHADPLVAQALAGQGESRRVSQHDRHALADHPGTPAQPQPASTTPRTAQPAPTSAPVHALATALAGRSEQKPSTNDGIQATAPGGLLAAAGPGHASGTLAGAARPGLPAMLSAPIGSADWQQQLSQQLVQMTQRGNQHMELHLHPRELGPLQITLQLNQHTAQAQFLANQAQVRDAVQQALPQLREALAGQGIALGQALVGQQQQPSQQHAGHSNHPRSRTGGVSRIESESTLPTTVRTTLVMPHASGHGGVDLYA